MTVNTDEIIRDAEDRLSDFSDQQKDFIWTAYKKVNIAHGGVRGGKNFAINTRLIPYLISEPVDRTDSLFGFLGESRGVIERNVFQDLKMLVGEANFKYNSQSGDGVILGRPIHVFDYKDKKSIKKLRGSNLGGFMITEAIFCPENIFDEAMKRCSVDNEKENSYSKGFIDTNPANQYHWLNKKYIATVRPDFKTSHFTYKDNLSNSQNYINFLHNLYPEGTLKNLRYVKGEWVAGEGVVYDCFLPGIHVIKPNQVPHNRIIKTIIGIDYGSVNATCFIKIGWDGVNFYVWDEYYYDSLANMKRKTNVKYTLALAAFMKGTQRPLIFLDPSADALEFEINESLPEILRKLNIYTNGFYLQHANNDIHRGIDIINVLFAKNNIFISEDCINLLEQIAGLLWDIEKAIKTGDEKPVKGVDHATDAFRYGIVSFIMNLIGDVKDIYVEEIKDYNDKLSRL